MNNKIFVNLDNELEEDSLVKELKKDIVDYIESNPNKDILAFLIQSPLRGDNKYIYEYKKGMVLLFPGHKFIFINLGNDEEGFEQYCEDFIEDLGALSDKYNYRDALGRPRAWKDKLIYKKNRQDIESISSLYNSSKFELEEDQRLSELLISLLTGSINDIHKIGGITSSKSLLEKVKRKIQLFDATQTNFLYQIIHKKRLTIQGLSGTGKTELLLHKLKDLYTSKPEKKICFTCHNKVLANKLKERIPSFFNFMKVEQQIEWNKYLWCCNAWGASHDHNSGAYRYICYFYGIPFFTFGQMSSFEDACNKAINEIRNKENTKGYAFDYMLIDESQDFGPKFIELCELVTENTIYVAGDIFQSIFSLNENSKEVDYLLNQCYRTDPKTLMFAHGLSMGLFEKNKLQWPTDRQWEAFGYIIKKEENDKIYNLTRNPIRRFEDIQDTEENSLYIKNSYDCGHEGVAEMIVDSILDIKKKNPTVQPSDISVILMTNKRSYNLGMSNRILSILGLKGIDWDINNAFETKENIDNKLFLTNHNNVKGLEFPFVICVSPFSLNNNLTQRNALYMAITRSFIRTDLIMPFEDDCILQYIENGLKTIQEKDCMIVVKPTEVEQDEIYKIRLQFTDNINKSYKEIVYDSIDKLNPNLSISDKGKILEVLNAADNEIYDPEELEKKLKPIVSLFNPKI